MPDAFRNMAQYTEYEILGYAGDPKEGNLYSVYLTVTTPYMTLTAEEMAAGADQTEKYTPFQSTGAAKKIASMNLEQVERGADFICLRFIIEDDVPVLYSCTSYFFESDATVQYAFFWGGINLWDTGRRSPPEQCHRRGERSDRGAVPCPRTWIRSSNWQRKGTSTL